MLRFLTLIGLVTASPLEAQVAAARSATYLFSSNVEDARALWVNPAGLGILPMASIYAELAADHTVGGDWLLRQYSFGLHSRAVAFGYQRDRFATGRSEGTWRFGAGLPLGRRAALGTAVSFTSPERGVDVGLRISPVPLLDIGAVVWNIGRPNVRGTKQPVSAVAGFAWRLARGRLGLQADAISSERAASSGYDMRYRAGLSVFVPARAPVSIVTALDLRNTLGVDAWSIGIGIGSLAQALVVGTGLPGSGSSGFQSFSVTGTARGPIRSRSGS